MRAKVFIIGLAGLFLLFAVPLAVHSECYYYSWYESCTTGPCDPNENYWLAGSEADECECVQDDYGYWQTCREEESTDYPDDHCTITVKLIDGCSKTKYEGHTMIEECVSDPQ